MRKRQYADQAYEVGAGPNAPAPSYGQLPPAAGGYEPLEAGYNDITRGMNTMNMGGAATLPPQAAPQKSLNQLIPTDLLSHPFGVLELDHPPPAIILPANVSTRCDYCIH